MEGVTYGPIKPTGCYLAYVGIEDFPNGTLATAVDMKDLLGVEKDWVEEWYAESEDKVKPGPTKWGIFLIKVSKVRKASYFLGDLFDILQTNVDNEYFSLGVKKRNVPFKSPMNM